MATWYWVGGAGTWDNTTTTNWSDTSGGAGSVGVPISTDNVIFDSLSGTGTITLASTKVVASFDSSAAPAGLITGGTSLNLTCNGNFTNSSTFLPGLPSVTMGGTGTYTCTSSINSLHINGTGITVTLGSNIIVGNALVIDNGTLDTSVNNYSITTPYLGLAAGAAKVINFRASTITLSGNGPNFLSFAGYPSTTTVYASLATFNVTSTSTTTNFYAGGYTYGTVTFNGTQYGGINISGNNTFGTLTINRTLADTISLAGNQIVTGTFTLNGTTSKRPYIGSSVRGTIRTISAATSTISYVDFEDINGIGLATWTGTSIGDCGGNSGITARTPATYYAVTVGLTWSVTGWSLTDGGASSGLYPLVQDIARYTSLSPAGTYRISSETGGSGWTTRYGTIDCTGFTRTLNFDNTIPQFYGSLILSPTQTSPSLSTSTNWKFKSRNPYSINSGGFILGLSGTSITIGDGVTGECTVLSNLNFLATGISINSSFNAGSYNISASSVISNSGVTRTINMGSGIWTVGWNISGNAWNFTSSGLTLIKGTATLKLNPIGTPAGVNVWRNLLFGNLSYYKLLITDSNDTIQLNDGANFDFVDISCPAASFNVKFNGGNVFNSKNWFLNGTATYPLTISILSGSPYTLTKLGGSKVQMNYVTVSSMIGLPASTWYAANSTNGGVNTGITFDYAPGVKGNQSNMFMF